MLILGIADNHDSSAALVEDGRLIAAIGQERIDRKKNSGAFPRGAIDAVLDVAGKRARDVDRIVCGTSFTPSYALRRLPRFHHDQKKAGGQFSYLLNLYISYQVGLRATGLHTLEIEACRGVLRERMTEMGFAPTVKLDMMDHHLAHAHAAYRTQPRERCLIVTLDAMGDGVSSTISLGCMGQLDQIWSQSGFAAINTYYSRITEWLGFTPNRHEGKLTGLAAYADPPPELVAHFRSQLRFVGPGFSTVNYLNRHAKDDDFYGKLQGWSREQIASALQKNLEDAVTDYIGHWVRKLGISDVALCGGVFANVKLNQRIAQIPEISSLWVFPNMGDGGLAVGAALATAEMPPHRPEPVYLGPGYSQSEIARELNIAGLRPQRPDDPGAEAAKLMAAGKVVARFDGRMEFGPRALGNRSLLVRPDLPEVNQWLNDRLERSEFMPFAPAVLAEDAPSLFVGYEKAVDAARFMTICFDCTDEMKQAAPGVVHLDGTARPQVVHREDNPDYYHLIEVFKDLTGVPAIVNTSFNMHEEPIVCSPFDAIRAWKRGHLDALLIGPYLVTQAPSEG